jgi:hypothetical protein
MPLLFNVVGFGSVLFLALGTNFVLLRVTSLVWLKAKWLGVILTPFGME